VSSKSLALALLLAGSLACNRPIVSGRIAVLRFENLTPDASLDWMGRAASAIVSSEISAPGPAEGSEGATILVLGQLTRTGNRLTLDITKRDAIRQRNTESFSVSTADPNGLYALADAAARRLSPRIVPFETRDNQALAAWAQALEAPDAQQAIAGYQRAVQADPGFASAWLAWSSAVAAQGDRAEAERLLAEAQQHAASFTPTGLARLTRIVAEQNFNGRQFQQAALGYRKLVELEPAEAPAWNQLGYVLAYSGDYPGALAALRSYQKLTAPSDPNPLDSQGDVAFLTGRFSDAVQFYRQSSAKNPSFESSGSMLKSAYALLLAGDLPSARKQFEAYAAARQSAADPTLAFRKAEWLYLTGSRDAALAAMQALAANPNPQLKSAALTQAALWELQSGHRDRARQQSDAAIKTGAPSAITLIARFASENATTPADWSARLDRLLAAPQLAPIKPTALAYALYFAHLWQPAEPVWKRLAAQAPTDDALTGIFYARILVEQHRPLEAEPFVRFFPIPRATGIQEFYTLAVPEILNLRAAVNSAQGKK
jgi:tetratricopeptide (TPR) repeat protein